MQLSVLARSGHNFLEVGVKIIQMVGFDYYLLIFGILFIFGVVFILGLCSFYRSHLNFWSCFVLMSPSVCTDVNQSDAVALLNRSDTGMSIGVAVSHCSGS